MKRWQIKPWQTKPWHRKQFTKIGWAAAVGISVGIAAAALGVHRPASVQTTSTVTTPYIVPVNTTSPSFSNAREQANVASLPADDGQVERLKTRNRRLEALVTVLRRRASERQ